MEKFSMLKKKKRLKTNEFFNQYHKSIAKSLSLCISRDQSTEPIIRNNHSWQYSDLAKQFQSSFSKA